MHMLLFGRRVLSLSILLIISLQFSLLCFPSTANAVSRAGESNSGSENDACEQSGERSWLFFGLHIAGVICGGIASGVHDYYASTIRKEMFSLALFYLTASATAGISLFLTYWYSAPDMLLIGTVVVSYIIRHKYPRYWTINFRFLHYDSPMWRTRKGKVFKRMRRKPAKEECIPFDDLERSKLPNDEWNGQAYQSCLSDGSSMIFLEEKDHWHWERTQGKWKQLMRQARLEDGPSRHAAAALRMAYAVPLPARVSIGRTEHFAVRGTLGSQVSTEWGIPQRELEHFDFLTNDGDRIYKTCRRYEDLAQLLHIKMISKSFPDSAQFEENWSQFSYNWLFGTLFLSNLPLEPSTETSDSPTPLVEESIYLNRALAYGPVHKGQDKTGKYWYLLNWDDSEQFKLERAPLWRLENGSIVKRHRRPLSAEERKTYDKETEDYRCKLVDGTIIHLKWEKESEFWEKNDEMWARLKKSIEAEYADENYHSFSIVTVAAIAYRMSYNMPLPVTVKFGEADRLAASTLVGDMTAKTWDLSNNFLSESFGEETNGEYKCTNYTDLAKVMFIKILAHTKNKLELKDSKLSRICLGSKRTGADESDKEKLEKSNMKYARMWLFGEILKSRFDRADEQELQSNALAYGEITEDESSGKWYLLPDGKARNIAKKRPDPSPDQSHITINTGL